jgi:hypothetical protein
VIALYFFDSSALVKRYVHEHGSVWVRETTASPRGQRKIFGKGDGDEITIGRQARLHLKKQKVMLHVT